MDITIHRKQDEYKQNKKNTQHNMCWISLYTRNKTNTNKIKKKHTTQYVLDITMHKKQDEYKQNLKKHTTQYVLDITIHKKQDEYKQN